MAFNLLPKITITAAATVTSPRVAQARRSDGPQHLSIEAQFVYGSAGTSAIAYVQTSFDGGATWMDVAALGFLTTTANKVVNLSSMTPVTTPVTPGDGALTVNTVQDGVFGDQWRVKVVSLGTYAGGTTLAVSVNGAPLSFFP